MEELKTEKLENPSTLFDVVTVFNGSCEHDWYDHMTDSDGFKHIRCRKCPMGRLEK